MQSVFIRIMLSALGCVVWKGGDLEPGLERTEGGNTGGRNSIQATHKPEEVVRTYADAGRVVWRSGTLQTWVHGTGGAEAVLQISGWVMRRAVVLGSEVGSPRGEQGLVWISGDGELTESLSGHVCCRDPSWVVGGDALQLWETQNGAQRSSWVGKCPPRQRGATALSLTIQQHPGCEGTL